ncbi:hypothetical protein CKN94_00875 [Carnobacterium maltaromaticum]|nr:hypothetical protein CKN94_00875 [Carnobacterium maltaromaticum]TFJ79488.1 hypothetical protein CKN97_00875 [Carnobacterium maltaromaticum]
MKIFNYCTQKVYTVNFQTKKINNAENYINLLVFLFGLKELFWRKISNKKKNAKRCHEAIF